MSRHLLARALVLVAACAVCVHAFDPMPSFPSMPVSLLELSESDAAPAVAPILSLAALREPSSAALVELDGEVDASLPSAEIAFAAAVPDQAMHADPLTAALAIEVPNPHTFLKDDVFLQQLVQQRETAEAAQFAEHAADLEAEGFFDNSAITPPSFTTQGPPPRRNRGGRGPPSSNHRAQKRGGRSSNGRSQHQHGRQSHGRSHQKKATHAHDHVGNAPAAPYGSDQEKPPHGSFAGKHTKDEGGLFPAHRQGSATEPLPRLHPAPHQPDINRRYRNAAGQFEANKSYRDTVQAAFKKGFAHHGGHTKAPHNKGRPESFANQPKNRHMSRHAKASKAKQFPHKSRKAAHKKKSTLAKKMNTFMEVSSTRRLSGTAGGDSFSNIMERRADLRAIAQRNKDEEAATMQAEADVKRLRALAKARQQVLDDHVDAAFKARSNLNTMFGASSGQFGRLPEHSSLNRRGSLAGRSDTPRRRLVPKRLARLEDQRRQAARRTYARGRMQETYHAQLHGTKLGAGLPPSAMGYTSHDSFLQLNEQHHPAQEQQPAMALPPQ